jgi:hypothetical protein
MAPRDNCFLSTITIFTTLHNLIFEDESDEEDVLDIMLDDSADEDGNFEEETDSQLENFQSSSEEIGEEIIETENNETPLTSRVGNRQHESDPHNRRLVFAARRLFSPDIEDDDEDFEINYLND